MEMVTLNDGNKIPAAGFPEKRFLSQANSGSRIMDMKQQRKVLKHLWKNWGLTM